MKFFADTRTKRNTAFVVMLVWMFALASSARVAHEVRQRLERVRSALVGAAAPVTP